MWFFVMPKVLAALQPERVLRGMLVLAGLFSIVLLGVTGYVRWTDDSGVLAYKFTLANENNVGAWWSGILLAAAALFATDGHARLADRDARAARGWLLVAGLLLFLSADEIGSLHERLGLVGMAWGIGPWGLLLPLGAVLGAAFLWAAAALWRAGERRQVAVLSTGFAILASVALQEYVEHAVDWGDGAAAVARLVVEEGSELCGILLLLGLAMTNTTRLGERPFRLLTDAWQPLGIATLVLAPALVSLTMGLETDSRRGRPIDWLAATVFLAAAALAARRILARAQSASDLVLVLLCGLASAATVAIQPAATAEIGPLVLGSRAVVLSGLALGIAALWVAGGTARRSATVSLSAAALLFLASPSEPFAAYLFPVVLAACASFGNRLPAASPAPAAMGAWPSVATPRPG
jgi:hypothetical protein